MEILSSYQLQLICSLCSFVISAVSSSTWTRDATLDNKLSGARYNVKARSRLHCSRTCSLNNTCVSFFFVSGQDIKCHIHDNIMTSPVGLEAVPSSMYYILDGASQPTTSPLQDSVTTIVPNEAPTFTCPTGGPTFRTVKLQDGSDFTYKVKKEKLNQPQAAAACAGEGGFLARVTTIAKMNMLLQLTNCSGYSEEDYHVDGSNADATNFTAADSWKMANGDPVPMTAAFWDRNKPDRPETDHCIRMDNDKNYKWNDGDCESRFIFFICEKE